MGIRINTKIILFVGPLPPPLNGYSFVNSKMYELLGKTNKLTVIDRTKVSTKLRFPTSIVVALISTLWCSAKVLLNCLFLRPKSAYVGVSGGYGQVLELFPLILLRFFGVKVYFHHHSFCYVNRIRLYNRLFFCLGSKNAVHIVLCESMGNGLTVNYGIPESNMRVVSNINFLGPVENSMTNTEIREGALKIGFLSNITREKGIFSYFDVLEKLKEDGCEVRGVIAGPVDEDIRIEFEKRIRANTYIEYIGAAYDENKVNFYDGIDLLLFPTEYPNEAEPVTIYEALKRGVNVIAYSRGCIPGINFGKYGRCISSSTNQLAELVCAARQFVMLKRDRRNIRKAAVSAYMEMFSRCNAQLLNVLNELSESN